MKNTKRFKLLVASLLMIGTTGLIMADDANQTIKENIKILKGTTIGHYQKPGAPVNLTYASTRVQPYEVADINITLTTPLKSGDMEVDIDIDKNLEQVGTAYSIVSFPLSENQKEYNLNLKVKSKKDGLYYIRLLIKVDDGTGVKMRALAVPVYVGNGRLQRKSQGRVIKALGGENISVSKAEETVEIIK
jgi:hypothetical protein